MKKFKDQSKLTIALVQYSMIWEDARATLELLNRLMEKQLKGIPDVIILPESFNTGFSMEASRVAETMDGPSVQWMKQLAFNTGAAVCGSLFITEEGKHYNRFLWVENGKEPLAYNKRHLFSMGDEHKQFTPGNEQLIINYKGWKIFPQICYDLRFPVWSRNAMNYDLLINVANWPETRRKVWKTLIKARAIENQCFVVAVSRVGKDGTGLGHAGKSMIVDPKGTSLLNAGSKEGIYQLEIDLAQRVDFMAKFDALKDADRFTLKG